MKKVLDAIKDFLKMLMGYMMPLAREFIILNHEVFMKDLKEHFDKTKTPYDDYTFPVIDKLFKSHVARLEEIAAEEAAEKAKKAEEKAEKAEEVITEKVEEKLDEEPEQKA